MTKGSEIEDWLIVKRDLYYKPDSCGYTGIKSKAGRYTKEFALSIARPDNTVMAFHEDDCPAYTGACFEDYVQLDLNRRLSEIIEICFDLEKNQIKRALVELVEDASMTVSDRRAMLEKESSNDS